MNESNVMHLTTSLCLINAKQHIQYLIDNGESEQRIENDLASFLEVATAIAKTDRERNFVLTFAGDIKIFIEKNV